VSPEESESYITALRDLEELSNRRAALRRKLENYRRFQILVEPLRDPQTNVQPNLVTRDGELTTELARSRTLSARVESRLGGLKDRSQDSAEGTVQTEDVSEWMKDMDGREKVGRLLGSW